MEEPQGKAPGRLAETLGAWMMPLSGFQRRCTRALLRHEAGRRRTAHVAGTAGLWGYGMVVAYPDRRVWLHQFIEIFCADTYGLRKLPERARVVDAGANIGMLSLYALWLRPDCRVIAVEPCRDNLTYLRTNLAQRASATVEVVPNALGRTTGVTGMAGLWSDAMRTSPQAGPTVKVVTLAELLDEPTDLLKLDVEGDELAVLEGGGERLRNVKRVVFENHEYYRRESSLTGILSLLQKQGFDRFRISGHRNIAPPDESLPVHLCMVEVWRSETPY